MVCRDCPRQKKQQEQVKYMSQQVGLGTVGVGNLRPERGSKQEPAPDCPIHPDRMSPSLSVSFMNPGLFQWKHWCRSHATRRSHGRQEEPVQCCQSTNKDDNSTSDAYEWIPCFDATWAPIQGTARIWHSTRAPLRPIRASRLPLRVNIICSNICTTQAEPNWKQMVYKYYPDAECLSRISFFFPLRKLIKEWIRDEELDQ